MVKPAYDSITLGERFAVVRGRVDSAARGCNRDPGEITLIAVSKTHPVETIKQAIAAGLTDFGENRVQEAEAKIEEAGIGSARWHLIGHLQTNKARRAVKLFDIIHTLDSTSMARRLDRLCFEEDKAKLPILIQIDLAREKTKAGATENQLEEIVAVVRECARLELKGLMILPPFFEDAERVRPYFRKLRELRDQLSVAGHFEGRPGELSMGMSHDFEVAIEEGATMVRIGTAIFGERIKEK
jgi:pyridoxal phosphate enzyme (YggS family)